MSKCAASPRPTPSLPRNESAFLAFRHVGVPRAAGFRLDVGETGVRRWAGNADEMLAGRALNLPAGVARVALQGLVAVVAIELEFRRAHRLHLDNAQTGRKKYIEEIFILFVRQMRM